MKTKKLQISSTIIDDPLGEEMSLANQRKLDDAVEALGLSLSMVGITLVREEDIIQLASHIDTIDAVFSHVGELVEQEKGS